MSHGAGTRKGADASPRGSLAAVMALLVGALAVGAATWLVATSGGCTEAATATRVSNLSEPTEARVTPPPGSTPGGDPQSSCERRGLLAGVVSMAGVLLVGGSAVVLARASRPRSPAAAHSPAPAPAAPNSPDQDRRDAGADRKRLIDALIYAIDRSQSAAVKVRLHEALAAAGVRAVGAPGETFDPSCHEAVVSVPTTSPQRDGILADVDAVGYLDGDVLIRPAQVSVYQEAR